MPSLGKAVGVQNCSEWFGDEGVGEAPLVSICCITYNHERYLRQALDSFLSQKTDFPVEILVHDDASTDSTPDIIRDYISRYPGRIRAILRTVNQQSQGVPIYPVLFEKARGKYISWCEGDDYFTDTGKLQRQVGFLEGHPDYSLSTHEGIVVSDRGRAAGSVSPTDVDRRLGTAEVISGGGGMIVTNSMVFRARFARELPNYYYRSAVADYPMAIHLALSGRVHYMATPMAAYRSARNNWTHAMVHDRQARLATHENMLELLRGVDEVSGGEFHQAVDRAASWHEFEVATLTGRVDRLNDPRFSEFYANQSPLWRGWHRLRTQFPRVGSRITALKRESIIRVNELLYSFRSRRR